MLLCCYVWCYAVWLSDGCLLSKFISKCKHSHTHTHTHTPIHRHTITNAISIVLVGEQDAPKDTLTQWQSQSAITGRPMGAQNLLQLSTGSMNRWLDSCKWRTFLLDLVAILRCDAAAATTATAFAVTAAAAVIECDCDMNGNCLQKVLQEILSHSPIESERFFFWGEWEILWKDCRNESHFGFIRNKKKRNKKNNMENLQGLRDRTDEE